MKCNVIIYNKFFYKMGICICCCCNTCKTSCIEIIPIVFSVIMIFFIIISIIIIDWTDASFLAFIIYIIMMVLLIIIFIFHLILKSWRNSRKIFSSKKKSGYVLAYISLAFSILCFLLSAFTESIIKEKLYRLDHPCWNYETIKDNLMPKAKNYFDNLCSDSKTNIYIKNKVSSDLDLVMSYVCSSVIQFFSLLLIFFNYNDARRIKYYVENKIEKKKGNIIYGKLGGYVGEYSHIKKKIKKDDEITKRSSSVHKINVKRNDTGDPQNTFKHFPVNKKSALNRGKYKNQENVIHELDAESSEKQKENTINGYDYNIKNINNDSYY